MIPKEIQDMVNDWAGHYVSHGELMLQIKMLADAKQVDYDELREFMESVLRAKGLSDRQASRLIPIEFKDQTKVKARLGKTRQSSDDIMSSEKSKEPATTLKELEDTISVEAKLAAEKVQPEPPASPHDDKRTDEPDDGREARLAEFTADEVRAIYPSFHMANRNGTGVRVFWKDGKIKAETSNRKLEVRTR